MDQSIERQAVRLYYIQKKQEFLTNIMVDKLLALQNLYDPEGNIPIFHELIFRGINLQYELRHLILSINDYDNYIHKLLEISIYVHDLKKELENIPIITGNNLYILKIKITLNNSN